MRTSRVGPSRERLVALVCSSVCDLSEQGVDACPLVAHGMDRPVAFILMFFVLYFERLPIVLYFERVGLH